MAELEKSRSPWWHIWKMSQEAAGLGCLRAVLIPADSVAITLAAEEFSIKDVNFREIDGFKRHFPDAPCFVMQAYSDKLIMPQFGKTALNAAALVRLKSFCGGDCPRIETEIPHLYG